jgi:arsenical pump membrane protein
LTAVNVGPVLAVTGSLAGLLWLDTVRRLGVPVDARTYSRVGIRVGLPALAAAVAVLLLTNRLVA